MSIILKNKETLQYKNFYFKCCIGKRGLTSNKKEGDQKTPKGEFGIEVGERKVNFEEVIERIKKVIKSIEPHDSKFHFGVVFVVFERLRIV